MYSYCSCRVSGYAAREDDESPIGEERSAVVTEPVGQPPDVRAVRIHEVEIQVALAEGRKDDLAAVRRGTRA